MKKTPNAYIRYRNDAIDIDRNIKMSEHSKVTGKSWQSEDSLLKNKFFFEYEKDLVKREIASGGNGYTEKTLDQDGEITFVNEFPKPRQTRSRKKKCTTNYNRIFKKYTINTDFLQE